MKFWWISVTEARRGGATVFGPKKCLTVAECNTLLKEMKEKYPKPEYQVYKESY
jgi:hypothetical protein